MELYNYLCFTPSLIVNGFSAAGILGKTKPIPFIVNSFSLAGILDILH